MKNTHILTLSKSIFVLSLLMVFLYACNKEDKDVNKPAEKASISVIDGVLKFDSEETYNLTIQKLQQSQDPSSLNDWEKQWKGFTSMRTAYNGITEEDEILISAKNSVKNTKYAGFMSLIGEGEEREAVRNVVGDVRATLVNKEGLIYIGNQAIHYSYEKKITFEDHKNFSKQNLLSLAASSDKSSDGIIVQQIDHKIFSTNAKIIDDPTARVTDREVSCLNEYWHGGTFCCKKRMVGEIAADNVSGDTRYEHVVARTKHQRRQSGIWYRDQAPQVRIDLSTVTIQDGNQTYTLSMSNKSANDEGLFEQEFNLNVGGVTITQFTMVSGTGNNSATCDDNVNRACTVYW